MTPKRSDYKTKAEYKWALKQERAQIKPFIYLALVPLIAVWVFTGSFIAGVGAAVAVPVILFGIVVLTVRAKQP